MERRYDEVEVRRIFDGASRTPPAHPSGRARGLTLSDVQSIGSEVGLDPAAIARAAAALDAGGAVRKPRTSLGMRVEVGRIVPLERAPTDGEWERIVATLRSTFRATGQVRVQGGLRSWTNGNLHACIEPAAQGYRLRLGTLKGDAAGTNALAAITLAGGVAVFVSMMLGGEPQSAIALSSILGASGVGGFVANALRLPRWARERERQMDYIAGQAEVIVNRP